MDSHKQMVLTFCNITALSCEHNPAAFRPSEFQFLYDELMGGMPQIAFEYAHVGGLSPTRQLRGNHRFSTPATQCLDFVSSRRYALGIPLSCFPLCFLDVQVGIGRSEEMLDLNTRLVRGYATAEAQPVFSLLPIVPPV